MDLTCERCSKKVQDTLGNVLVAGWMPKNPDMTPSKRGAWLCPECTPPKPRKDGGG